MLCCLVFSLGLVVSVGTYLYFFRKKNPIINLNNKVVVIVGAGTGIGEACAHEFYKHNCKLILCGKALHELEKVKKDIQDADSNGQNKNEIAIFELDLCNFDDIPKVVDEFMKVHNGIDILINNAGISYRGKIVDTQLSVYQLLMNINCFGHIAVTKGVLKDMIEKRSGHIVFMSSLQGKLSIPHRSAYSASKHAIQAFADCLRAEIAQYDIGVSVISPAYVRTNLSVNAVTSSGSTYGKMDENQKKGMEVKDVARAVVETIVDNRDEVLLASCGYKMAVYFRNIFACLYFKAMARRAKE